MTSWRSSRTRSSIRESWKTSYGWLHRKRGEPSRSTALGGELLRNYWKSRCCVFMRHFSLCVCVCALRLFCFCCWAAQYSINDRMTTKCTPYHILKFINKKAGLENGVCGNGWMRGLCKGLNFHTQLFSYTMQHWTNVFISVKNVVVVLFCLSVRPTLSHAQSVAIWSRNTSCVASVMQRCARRRLQSVSRLKQWKVDRWEHQQWKLSSCTRERHQVKMTKTRELWRDPGKGLHGSASDVSVLLERYLLGNQSDWHPCDYIFCQWIRAFCPFF